MTVIHLPTELVFNGYVITQYRESEATQFHFIGTLILYHEATVQTISLFQTTTNTDCIKYSATVQGDFMHHLTTAEL